VRDGLSERPEHAARASPLTELGEDTARQQ
jgi:hypothetical protein